jgi:hypothetical protein
MTQRRKGLIFVLANHFGKKLRARKAEAGRRES